MESTVQSMDVDENELKVDKIESKLPFSIENLLADKFERKEKSEEASIAEGDDFEKGFYKSEENHSGSDDNDDKSDNSEQVDVESSTAGDAQEFMGGSSDYQQSGMRLILLLGMDKFLVGRLSKATCQSQSIV